MTTVAVLQPSYLPWLGYFDQIRRSDIFVFYDDVQFDKNGWRNRNRIKSPAGPQWLTVPVRHAHLNKPAIMEVEIDNRGPWAQKQMRTIEALYKKAPSRTRYLPELSEVLMRPWENLVELDIAVLELMMAWLGLERKLYRSSELGVGGERSERLLRLCHHFKATRYLSGDAAQNYLDLPLFEQAGIEVVWQDYRHPSYAQLHGEFVPYLSALDLLLNVGDESLSVIAGKDLPK